MRDRDPLVNLLKMIREAHGISQSTLESLMNLPKDTIRHIEKGRRGLPDFRNGQLTQWIKMFINCIDATSVEKKQILDLMAREILDQFGILLDQQTDDQQTDDQQTDDHDPSQDNPV